MTQLSLRSPEPPQKRELAIWLGKRGVIPCLTNSHFVITAFFGRDLELAKLKELARLSSPSH